MHLDIPSGVPPAIIVSSRDFDRLEQLLDSPAHARLPAAIALMGELHRAEVVSPQQMPADVVTMGSTVECSDEISGERHALTLVYPHEADVDAGRVSVLTPVGSALLGLSVGQGIDWDVPGVRRLRLRVNAVRYRPEPEGALDR